jgi:nickel/cobalt transporter (NiCoT) family protein
MTVPPADALGLAALVLALGLKHGFDPDHLAAIDGLTRSSQSRWCGLYFSLGHGTAVTVVGAAVTLAAMHWQPPAWLALAGVLISAGMLLVLGWLNLKELSGIRHPALIASVGAAFSLSFDTLAHALLFSAHGAAFAILLGALFTLGMVITDALNGWWVARMIRAADRRAAIASRWMSRVVAALCLLVAALGFTRYFLINIEYSAAYSLATLAAIGAVSAWAMLRFRSAYREAGS